MAFSVPKNTGEASRRTRSSFCLRKSPRYEPLLGEIWSRSGGIQEGSPEKTPKHRLAAERAGNRCSSWRELIDVSLTSGPIRGRYIGGAKHMVDGI